MKKIEEYNQKLVNIKAEIKLEADKAWEEIQKAASQINDNRKKVADEANEAPCSVCSKSEYIIKYREVVGEIHGKVSGYYSLFGGSISGYVDGETHTNPVLSCRNCGNEKLVKIAEYKSASSLLEEQMPSIYNWTSPILPKPWLLEKGLEVARELGEHLFCPRESSDIRNFNDESLKAVGFKNKYTLPLKPGWLESLLDF